MTESDIFVKTKGAYLSLIHPILSGGRYRQEVAPVIALAPTVPDQLVASLLVGASWRERLLGLCLAMAKRPESFIEPVLQSLRDPRGIAIVPACAMLGVLARSGQFAIQVSLADDFDRSAFDGEVGWGMDKALHHAGLSIAGVGGRGPNYGQVFEDHVEVYEWIHASSRRGS